MIIVKTAPKLNLSHLLLNKHFGRQSGRQISSTHGILHKHHYGAVLGAVKSLPIVYQMTSQSGVLRKKVVDKPTFLWDCRTTLGSGRSAVTNSLLLSVLWAVGTFGADWNVQEEARLCVIFHELYCVVTHFGIS